MSSVTHPLQNFSPLDHVHCPGSKPSVVRSTSSLHRVSTCLNTPIRNITDLRFADDIGIQAEDEQEPEALVESLDKTCTSYKMEISAEKTRLMTASRG